MTAARTRLVVLVLRYTLHLFLVGNSECCSAPMAFSTAVILSCSMVWGLTLHMPAALDSVTASAVG